MIEYGVPHTCILDFNLCVTLFEMCKTASCDYLIIPRTLFQSSAYSSIVGVKGNTVVSIHKYDYNPYQFADLWDEPTLSHIIIQNKDLSPFIRQMKDNNLSTMTLLYNKFKVNDREISVGKAIFNDTLITVSTPQGPVKLYPTIQILPDTTSMMNNIVGMISLFNDGNTVGETSLEDNETFLNIMSTKASDGALLWFPPPPFNDPNYMMFLAKSMIPMNKNDKIKMTIKNNLKVLNPREFIVEFEVVKKKKKGVFSYHKYYMKGVGMI